MADAAVGILVDLSIPPSPTYRSSDFSTYTLPKDSPVSQPAAAVSSDSSSEIDPTDIPAAVPTEHTNNALEEDLLEHETFDFNLSLDASKGKSDEDEASVVGAVSIEERLAAAAESSPARTAPLVTPCRPAAADIKVRRPSPLKPQQMVEIFKEATTLACHISINYGSAKKQSQTARGGGSSRGPFCAHSSAPKHLGSPSASPSCTTAKRESLLSRCAAGEQLNDRNTNNTVSSAPLVTPLHVIAHTAAGCKDTKESGRLTASLASRRITVGRAALSANLNEKQKNAAATPCIRQSMSSRQSFGCSRDAAISATSGAAAATHRGTDEPECCVSGTGLSRPLLRSHCKPKAAQQPPPVAAAKGICPGSTSTVKAQRSMLVQPYVAEQAKPLVTAHPGSTIKTRRSVLEQRNTVEQMQPLMTAHPGSTVKMRRSMLLQPSTAEQAKPLVTAHPSSTVKTRRSLLLQPSTAEQAKPLVTAHTNSTAKTRRSMLLQPTTAGQVKPLETAAAAGVAAPLTCTAQASAQANSRAASGKLPPAYRPARAAGAVRPQTVPAAGPLKAIQPQAASQSTNSGFGQGSRQTISTPVQLTRTRISHESASVGCSDDAQRQHASGLSVLKADKALRPEPPTTPMATPSRKSCLPLSILRVPSASVSASCQIMSRKMGTKATVNLGASPVL